MSLFDLSASVALMTTHTITVSRFAADTFGSDGRPLARVLSSTFTAGASVQPAGEPLDRDADGLGSSDLVSIFCVTPLMIRDRIAVPGLGSFEVEKLENWQPGGAFSEVVARRLDPVFEPVPEFIDGSGKAIALAFGSPTVTGF